MALTGWSSTNNLSRAAVFTGAPFFISAWGRVGNAGATLVWLQAINSADTTQSFSGTLSSGVAHVQRRDSGGITTTDTTAGPSANTWFHMFIACASATDARVLLDGANKGTSGASRTPSGIDTLYLGVTENGAGTWGSSNGLCEISCGTVSGLSSADIDNLAASLAGGANPINLQASGTYAGKFTSYWLDSDNTTTDLIGSNDLTVNGTLTDYGSHPTIDAPGGTTLTGDAQGAATSSATGEQLTAVKGYRWRNDDGSEAAATWAAAENTAHTISNGAHARLRFLVRAPLAGQYQLEVAEVGTSNWSKVQVE